MPAFNPNTSIGDLSGKVFLITGGTAGLGANTIRALSAHSPEHIYFTGRNAAAAQTLISSINQTHPSAKLTFIHCDQSQLSSVVSAARQFLASATRLDVLMLNAGIMATPAAKTHDGYEAQFQTNHLSHALLVKLLLPILRQTATAGADVRVVSLASSAFMLAPMSNGIDFASLKSEQRNLGGWAGEAKGKWTRYGQSKLANVLYADELARREPGITSVSLHPGYVRTDLITAAGYWTTLPIRLAFVGQWVEPEKGCWNQAWAATAPKGVKSGGFYNPVGKVAVRWGWWAGSEKLAGRLWEWTEEELKRWNLDGD